jgi:hypothetical protein
MKYFIKNGNEKNMTSPFPFPKFGIIGIDSFEPIEYNLNCRYPIIGIYSSNIEVMRCYPLRTLGISTSCTYPVEH